MRCPVAASEPHLRIHLLRWVIPEGWATRRTRTGLPVATVRLVATVRPAVVSRLIPGFHVSSIPAALIAALVIGLVNATLGVLLKIITFPLTILTLGIFWFIINALMLEVASWILKPAFWVDSFVSAFWGAIVLSLVNMMFRWLAGTSRREE